jgi:signal transduction histidine kinase
VGPDGKEVDCSMYLSEIPLSYLDNTIVQSINQKKLKISPSLSSVLLTKNGARKGERNLEKENIKSVFTYSLVVRDELIGAMVIGLKEDEQRVSEYRKDLLNRLAETVGIAIDSSLLYNQVQSANERLQALDKLKNEFVSVASHELRTPMTAIKSYLWMALEGKGGKLNEKQKYYIDRGYNSVDRLIRLVNDMLNISRIESGRITIDLQATDLVKLAQEVIDEVLPRAKEVAVTIKMQKPKSLPPVLADADKIKEVLFNLIGNSLKFTPKGGTITINFIQKSDFIETAVVDTGAGNVHEDLGKLFQKFGLLEGSYITNQTSTHMGTGLGLYICRSIIDLHHGEIKAESEGRGKGSRFSFTLKVFKVSDMRTLKKETKLEKDDTVDLIHAQI